MGTAHPRCYLSPTDGKLAGRATRETGRNPVERIGEGLQPPHQRWIELVGTASPTCFVRECATESSWPKCSTKCSIKLGDGRIGPIGRIGRIGPIASSPRPHGPDN